MNLKRWFAWACLALMLVAEVLLFRANHERDAARSDLRDALKQLHDAQAELVQLKNSTAGVQAGEMNGLRKQNELLTAKVSALQKNLDRVQAESQDTEAHLTKARKALEIQQESLQALQAEHQRTVMADNATACIRNLQAIDQAKQQWALEKGKSATDVPTAEDLLPYFRGGLFPVCPDGGTYTINAVGELPQCSIPGHVLQQ